MAIIVFNLGRFSILRNRQMARKTYLNSFRKTNWYVNKTLISSKNHKLMTKAVTSLSKKKARSKLRRQSKKCERKVFSEYCESNAKGSLTTFKVSREKRYVSVDQAEVEDLDTFSLRSDAVETSSSFRESVMECGWCDSESKQIASTTSLTNPDVNDCSQVWSVTTTTDFPKTWTEEMIRYYSEPNEKLKDFDYIKIMDNIECKYVKLTMTSLLKMMYFKLISVSFVRLLITVTSNTVSDPPRKSRIYFLVLVDLFLLLSTRRKP